MAVADGDIGIVRKNLTYFTALKVTMVFLNIKTALKPAAVLSLPLI